MQMFILSSMLGRNYLWNKDNNKTYLRLTAKSSKQLTILVNLLSGVGINNLFLTILTVVLIYL